MLPEHVCNKMSPKTDVAFSKYKDPAPLCVAHELDIPVGRHIVSPLHFEHAQTISRTDLAVEQAPSYK